MPRSLSRRAAAVNGTCRVSAEGRHVIVEVVLPVRCVPTASTSTVDGSPFDRMPIDAGEEIDVVCDHDDAASQEVSVALCTPTPGDGRGSQTGDRIDRYEALRRQI